MEITQGSALQVTETDTIEVRYAVLPCIDLSVRYLVQVMTPVALIPTEERIFLDLNDKNFNPLQVLSSRMLTNWENMLKGHKREIKKSGSDWLLKVDKVKLIECDLLVPKR